MPDESMKRPGNTPGAVFVDDHCICCSTCVAVAPEHFDDVDGDVVCVRQPTDRVEAEACAEAARCCPVDAIGGTSAE